MTTLTQTIPAESTEAQRVQADLAYDRWKSSPERLQQEVDLAQHREAGTAPYPFGYRSTP